jgi:hypothetical protein
MKIFQCISCSVHFAKIRWLVGCVCFCRRRCIGGVIGAASISLRACIQRCSQVHGCALRGLVLSIGLSAAIYTMAHACMPAAEPCPSTKESARETYFCFNQPKLINDRKLFSLQVSEADAFMQLECYSLRLCLNTQKENINLTED